MADEKTPEKASLSKTPAPAPEAPVLLYLGHPHTEFDLSGVGLDNLVPEGTAYSPKDADTVRMLCLKYGVRLLESR